MSDRGDVRPENFVEYRLVRLADQLERRFTAALAPAELSPRQFSVLAVLASTPEITSAGLARAVLTTPQSMHTLLDQLQSRGLIDRGPVRGRGRPAPVRPTTDGLALLATAGARVTEREDETRTRLGETDYHQLVRLLDRVEDIIGVDRSGEK
ncbi:MAG TPA: MarR family winged helix-turn-helix transcriptional regulator [Actinomycetospora sp.]|nr:MarR family winged helix-turn-helix transcriptional regulator [Actinomycetospora sp.]